MTGTETAPRQTYLGLNKNSATTGPPPRRVHQTRAHRVDVGGEGLDLHVDLGEAADLGLLGGLLVGRGPLHNSLLQVGLLLGGLRAVGLSFAGISATGLNGNVAFSPPACSTLAASSSAAFFSLVAFLSFATSSKNRGAGTQ